MQSIVWRDSLLNDLLCVKLDAKPYSCFQFATKSTCPKSNLILRSDPKPILNPRSNPSANLGPKPRLLVIALIDVLLIHM